MADLLDGLEPPPPAREEIAEGAVLLRGFVLPFEPAVAAALDAVVAAAPFRHMTTPGGYRMSVAMTNCGAAGWIADRAGYRYSPVDPGTGAPWPPMPDAFLALAAAAAAEAGYPGFRPDACLINRYDPGARLSLHQDRDERDLAHPIVSVSLGQPATFLFGGLKRGDPVHRFALRHGDVAVWGGPSRLRFHGVAAVRGGGRINLTLRKH